MRLRHWDRREYRALVLSKREICPNFSVLCFVFKKPFETTKWAWVVSLGLWFLATVPGSQISEEEPLFILIQEEHIVDLCLMLHCCLSQKHKLSPSSLNSSGTLSLTRALGTLDRMLWLTSTLLPAWGPGR